MSTEYIVYTEFQYKGKWHLADPLVFNKDGGYKRAMTYWSSGSYFNEAWDELRHTGRVIDANELSSELYEEIGASAEDGDIPCMLLSVPVSKLAIKEFANAGYVEKQLKASFEAGQLDELWPVTLAELTDGDNVNAAAMAALFEKFYEYYEWDNPFDWQYQFKQLCREANKRIADIGEANYLYESIDSRIICQQC